MSGTTFLLQRIEFIRGVGEAKSKVLASELGVRSVEDMLNVFPFRYDDRSVFGLIKDTRNGDAVQLKGILFSLDRVKMKRGFRLKGSFKDPSGIIELSWFQGAKWIEEALTVGQEYVLYGKIKVFGGKRSIAHPEMETLAKAQQQSAYLPVYPSTAGLDKKNIGQRTRRNIFLRIFEILKPLDLPEILPEELLSKLNLCSRYHAYKWIHFPENEEERRHASNRLKFEELLFLQLKILQTKKLRERQFKGFVFDKVGENFNRFFKEKLTFELTNAQKRVIKEIRYDIGAGVQMNRLLQGDVGSGKTIVALMAMLIAIDNGYQATLLAPTEILARQHFTSISESLKGLGIQCAFLSGSVKGKTRANLFSMLKEGHIDILIGTHAILEDPVQFKKLGIAVTDEQHRFGVAQRSKLWTKNKDVPPHILVMTATPIPRTLAMTSYGDLDVSVIDELPPGRKPVLTEHRSEADRMRIIKFMKKEIAAGRQIYIVYPLIEESATLDLENLDQGYQELLNYFPLQEYQIAIVHGRMKAADKEMEMQRFVQGRAHIMVATTVIEVGVNVPNASIMIIENAARFGLSQLHQLRGRVGRGADQAYCVLMTKSQLSYNAKERIKTMCRTNDGFEIAEVDMRLRGPGDIEGTMQSGIVDLKIASITNDVQIMQAARHFALEMLNIDASLEFAKHQMLAKELAKQKGKNQSWGRIS
ncbi:MAG: ATP-dependent DNA helicase RecG [Saprospiraceae bacterium]|jgi:ATP-dependent DNA helicase RecG